jgi:drug/metabolite transporter (DMT)-like permease
LILLLLSILLNAYLILSFKVVERYGIPVVQAIVFNYITCVITGTVINGGFPVGAVMAGNRWLYWSLLMGAMFFSIFNLIGFTAQRIGVSVASVVTKLSLVIPFLFSVYLYAEKVSFLQVCGVAIALAAVVCISLPSKGNAAPGKSLSPFLRLLIPVVLFISTGLLDTLVKFVEQGFLNKENNDAYLITTAVFVRPLLSIAFNIGFPAVPAGSPSSLARKVLPSVPRRYAKQWCAAF